MISCPVGSRVAAGKFGEEAAYKEPNYSLASYYGTLDKWESGAGVAVLSAAHSELLAGWRERANGPKALLPKHQQP